MPDILSLKISLHNKKIGILSLLPNEQTNANREFSLLWALGEDLPGALTALPNDDQV